MKKKVVCAGMALMSAAMFGILYPEYILLPDTYDYIEDQEVYEENSEFEREDTKRRLSDLLKAAPQQIRFSSKLLQLIAEEWK